MQAFEARTAIQRRFLVDYEGVFPISLDNQGFSVPKGDTPLWTRLNVTFTPGADVTLGRKTNRRFTRAGILIIQVFTAAESATLLNDQRAQEFLDVYDGETLTSDLWFVEGGIRTAGTDGKWYLQNVVLPFRYSEKK